MKTRAYFLFGLFILLLMAAPDAVLAEDVGPKYVIAVSETTLAEPAWKKVAEKLAEKHKNLAPEVMAYKAGPEELLEKLKKADPKFLCFLAKPEEANANFVRTAHKLGRLLDDDPFVDVFWGILTGYDAANALRIAEISDPLTVKKGAGSTPMDLEPFEEAVRWDDQTKNKVVRKLKDGKPTEEKGPDDPCAAIVEMLNGYKPDLWLTSGHATEHDWMIGFSYPAGTFRHKDGKLFGLTLDKKELPVDSPNPKVHLPVGNCLIGNIDKADCMATSYMNSAGVTQMVGYIVPTWFGFAGWGMVDYYIEQPGRYTFTEAFFANMVALDWNIEQYKKANPGFDPGVQQRMTAANQGAVGLAFDRDVVAFYGDPAWDAKMAEAPKAWSQVLKIEQLDGNPARKRLILEITAERGADSWKPAREKPASPAEGRFRRPIVQWLPEKFENVKLIEGESFEPLIKENFILVPIPKDKETKSIKIVFEADAR